MFHKYLLSKKGMLLMKKFDYQKVESIIGYHFNNGKLLKQAFFRSSFAHENNRESNEVLEFIGDKVLDLAIIRILLGKYTKTNDEEYFKSNKQEGDLTKIKSELVSTNYLANALDELGLTKFIYYGKSDTNNNANAVLSMKEDVFEAIIGAVALDSNWDMDKIIKIVKKLLHTDEFLKQSDIDNNYVGILQELVAAIGLKTPAYTLVNYDQNGAMVWRASLRIEGIKSVTYGYGFKQKEAKKEAAKEMIPLVKLYVSQKEQQKKTETKQEDVFSVINYLVQLGEISKPEYRFEEDYDDEGNPIWECETNICESDYLFYGYGSSKKEAQKNSLNKAIKEMRKAGIC